ncbi:MAG: TetR/AcrR family transcriptional regulator [Verrucomicrobiae bacterium]|nr:TetR/AcrR family transcriptional regulator [Verrucomicrobiae bacterium]MCP5523982.1 TetR/AcrR family transcriptional regulator [Verrucomicrobiales bacterium]
MSDPKSKGSARDSILDAAEALVNRLGAAHLTLDAVAQQAAVSKGGLLYHFPSKDALLEAMVARQLAQFEEDQAGCLKGDPDDPTARLLAFVHASLNDGEEDRRLGAALLAAVANKPELLEPARGMNRELSAGFVRNPLGHAGASVVWLATLGLWFLEVLQVSPFAADQRQAITDRILAMAQGAS